MEKDIINNNDINNDRPLRVIVSGGGTGGHIFPAVSIADAIRRRHPDAEILFVGALGRMEMERVPRAGYDIVGLPVAGFDRKRLWRNFGVLIKLWKSMRKARKVLRDFKPDIAIGVGGYASGPMLKIAQKAGVKTLLQEQNSYAGVTNKMLGKGADKICVAYTGMDKFFPADKICLTGNPVRSAVVNMNESRRELRQQLGFSQQLPLVVVVGGSLGARTINESVAAALELFEQRRIQVLWQTGKLYYEECSAKAAGYKNVRVEPFISDMATAYGAADLVVSRAGASTISELQNLGKASILVPSPNVAEDHQTKNAMRLVEAGAAVMIPDVEAPLLLGKEVVHLIETPDRIGRFEKAAAAMALENADEKIVDQIDLLLKK